MRPLVFLFFLLPVYLFAQQKNVDIFGKGWYLSLTLEPQISSEFDLSPYVTANDTLAREIGLTGSLPFRFADTVMIDGNDVIYYNEPGLRRNVSRAEAIFSLLGSVRFHYRENDRFEFSAGFFYRTNITDEERTDDFSAFPNDAYYFTSVNKNIYGGIVTDFNYHFRKDKRLRPYLGMEMRFGLSHTRNLGGRQIFPGLGQESDLAFYIVERFRKNTILDFDLDFLAGINYQVSNRVAIGIEARPNRYFLPIPAALQVRYQLNGKGTNGISIAP